MAKEKFIRNKPHVNIGTIGRRPWEDDVDQRNNYGIKQEGAG